MDKKPRILHITDGIGKAGIEKVIIEKTLGLCDEFDFGHLGLFGRASLDKFFAERGEFAECAEMKRVPLYLYPTYFTKVDHIAEIARKFAPDIVQAYNPPLQWFVFNAAKKIGAKCLFEAHNANIYRRKVLATFVERKGVAKAHAVITVSQYVADHYRDYFKIDNSGFKVVHNGIDTGVYRPAVPDEKRQIRKSFGIPENALVVGNVGRFTFGKRISFLARAFAEMWREYPNLHLLLVGDGDEDEIIREILADVDSDRKHLPGFVNDPEKAYRALDIFVLPSVNEAFALVFLEAKASGIAAVSTKVGGVIEAGIHEKDCLFIPPDDSDALKSALRRLIEDEALRNFIAQNARLSVVDRFSLAKMIEGEAEVYRSLLRGK